MKAMLRPKGSKNKPVLTIDGQTAQITAEIESLQEQIREKKAELKQQKLLMAAVLASGKTIDEIIEMISRLAQ